MKTKLSQASIHAVAFGVGMMSLLLATPSEASGLSVKNSCINSLTALVYDEKDISVIVPAASARNISMGKTMRMSGLSSSHTYKVHFTGSCSSVKMVVLNRKSFPCQIHGTLEAWLNNVKSNDSITCTK